MRRLTIVLAGVGAILAVAVLMFLWPPDESTEVAIGTVEAIEASQVVYLQQHRLFVVATEDGFIALADDSRHVGDRVLFCRSNGTFSSPAHGEIFDPQGRYMGGPAGGDLGRYSVTVHDGQVVVDVAEMELPERSTPQYQLVGPRCDGPREDPPGFYSDGLP
jgi:Rieske Fe-S protein